MGLKSEVGRNSIWLSQCEAFYLENSIVVCDRRVGTLIQAQT